MRDKWFKHRMKSRDVVMGATKWRCQACDAVCGPPAGQWCHLFGRGQTLVSEPMASLPALTTWLCTSCHDRIDGRSSKETDIALKTHLREIALAKLAIQLHVRGENHSESQEGTARRMSKQWEKPIGPPDDLTPFYFFG